ncbi:LysR family transcriptional regulator [Sphingomonas sp. BK580]|uniref:LysR family transcriptional regulator n=1 Tax=Sphingomonas sp. BK580 TaxID=2586972 RepID=UPI00160A63A0|nr:LysR family transcriptional regulator [Sphingomonas sp. BK580]MBB3695596.1 DNA-binding transcriptional LysR family regulator [Sphingomonas sp. BK580]
MIRNIDVALLRAFVCTVDHGSLTAAAAALRLTQSAVSQQLLRLERLLQAQLLIRDHNGSRTTPAGARLLERARTIVAMNDALWVEMTGREVTGRVRLGAPDDLIGTVVQPALKRFSSAFPDVELSVLSSPSPELMSALETGHIDLVLSEQLDPLPGHEQLRRERLVWIGARGGNAQRRTPLPVSLTAPGCAFRAVIAKALHDVGQPSNPVLDGEGTEATLAAVRADLAVGVWLESMVPEGLEVIPAGNLPSLPQFTIQLGLPSRFPASAATQMLAQEVRRELAAMNPSKRASESEAS